jgi:(1->4)-alpha-D-glucan 1-alpha-D-glucosylmutase
MLASLSKLKIKLTAPGVPDCYQGNELPDLSLVDPDNRRPVDYAMRRRLLAEVKALTLEDARALLATPEDPRAKLFVTWRLLGLRRDHAALFRDGRYVPLEVSGPRASHLFCFARVLGREASLTIAGRLFARLVADGTAASAGWEGTRVETPFLPEGARLVDVLTGGAHRVARGGLDLAQLYAHAPGAVLYCADVGAS